MIHHNLISLTKEQEEKVFSDATAMALEVFAPLNEFDEPYIVEKILPAAYQSSRMLTEAPTDGSLAFADSVVKKLEEEFYDGKNVLGLATAVLQTSKQIELNMMPANQTKEDHIGWLTKRAENEKIKQANNRFQAAKSIYRSAYEPKERPVSPMATHSHVKLD